MSLAAVPDTLFLSQTAETYRGAELLGLLAYPEPDKLDDRALTMFRVLYRSAPPEFDWVKTAAGGVMPVDRRRAEGGAKRIEERLRRRLLAGHVAARGLASLESGTPVLGRDGAKWTLDGALRQEASENDWPASTNLHKRVWATSTPVIHVAAAWVRAIAHVHKLTGVRPDLFVPITSPSFLDLVVVEAGRLETLIPKCAELRIRPGDLIKLR